METSDPSLAYQTAKFIHVVCVALSIGGFIARFKLSLCGIRRSSSIAFRVLPHVNDTALLVAAFTMLALGRVNPLTTPWIVAKLCALVAYIGLGMIALGHGRTKVARVAAFIGALAVFTYIVSVALSRSALGAYAWIVA